MRILEEFWYGNIEPTEYDTSSCKEYGVSQSALGKWIKQYSTVEIDDGKVLTAKQVKELQKRENPK